MSTVAETKHERPVKPPEFFDPAIAYMRRHFATIRHLSNVSASVGLSMFHFCHEFRRSLGTTPKRVLTGFQIEEAKRLLLKGEALSVIPRRCGFATQSHFASRFKMETGMTPTRWQREARQGKAA